MAGNWRRAVDSVIFIAAVTAIYWLIAGFMSVLGLFMYFGDYGAGHGGDAVYMHEMYRQVSNGRWIAFGIATIGYIVIVATIFRARWFKSR